MCEVFLERWSGRKSHHLIGFCFFFLFYELNHLFFCGFFFLNFHHVHV